MRMKTKVLALFSTALGVLVLGGAVAVASAGVGFSVEFSKKGTLATPVEVSFQGIDFSTEGKTDVWTQKPIFDPKGHSGWHMHPGLVIVTVIEGSLTSRTGCGSPVLHVVGDSFIEPPMKATFIANASDKVRAVSLATVVVPHGTAPRIEIVAPVCTNPSDD